MISRGGRVERDDERHDRDHEREDGDRARPEIAATLLPEARERGLQNREDDEVLRRPGLSYEQALDSSRPGNTSSRSGRGGGRDGRRRCWGRLRARRRWPECRSARRSSLPGCPRGSSRTRPGAVCRSPAEARSLSEVASQLTRAQPPRRSGWAPLTAPSTSAADQGSRRTRRPGRRIAAQPDAPRFTHARHHEPNPSRVRLLPGNSGRPLHLVRTWLQAFSFTAVFSVVLPGA